MTEGKVYDGFPNQPFYTHLQECAVLDERERQENAQRQADYRRRAAQSRANFPAELALDIAGYEARYGVTPDTRRGLELCRAFSVACHSAIPHCGFTLVGSLGVGKTTIVVALGRTLFGQGVDVRFEKAPALYNRLLHASREGDLDEELRILARVKVLILDDLGREKPTPWWVDQVLWPLVDERYTAGRPLVITTNYTWDGLTEKYANARNEREQADSAASVVDRLIQRSAAVRWGGEKSKREAGWDFLDQRRRGGA